MLFQIYLRKKQLSCSIIFVYKCNCSCTGCKMLGLSFKQMGHPHSAHLVLIIRFKMFLFTTVVIISTLICIENHCLLNYS